MVRGTWLPRRWGALVILLSLTAACATAPAGPALTIEGAWARPVMTMAAAPAPPATPDPHGGHGATSAGGVTTAVYLTLRNTGGQSDRLLAAATDIAAAVELHETSLEGGIMRMRPVNAIDIPAGGVAELKPGGLHIMLIGVRRDLLAGQTFEVTLTLERTGTRSVTVEVRPN